jgi:hypothetical protein
VSETSTQGRPAEAANSDLTNKLGVAILPSLQIALVRPYGTTGFMKSTSPIAELTQMMK